MREPFHEAQRSYAAVAELWEDERAFMVNYRSSRVIDPERFSAGAFAGGTGGFADELGVTSVRGLGGADRGVDEGDVP